MSRVKIVVQRELLLVEIERRCRILDCNAKTQLGLTKDDARAYGGFECERCQEWNVDVLGERDIPEWWEELAVTDLYALRDTGEDRPNKVSDIVSRMSDSYRQTKAGDIRDREKDI